MARILLLKWQEHEASELAGVFTAVSWQNSLPKFLDLVFQLVLVSSSSLFVFGDFNIHAKGRGWMTQELLPLHGTYGVFFSNLWPDTYKQSYGLIFTSQQLSYNLEWRTLHLAHHCSHNTSLFRLGCQQRATSFGWSISFRRSISIISGIQINSDRCLESFPAIWQGIMLIV